MSDSRSVRPATSRAPPGPARAMLIAIAIVALIIVVGAVTMFHGPKRSNPISTAGSAAMETTAPGDRAKGP